MKAFCFSGVLWQAWICLDKYKSQPVATSVSYIENDGQYPPAVTLCKNMDYAALKTNSSVNSVQMEYLVRIETMFEDNQEWTLIYENGTVLGNAVLPFRRFTTFTWSDTEFKCCISFQLGTLEVQITQIRITHIGITDVRIPPNLQIFLNDWGSYSMHNYEVHFKEHLEVYQIKQEAIASLSATTSSCSSDRTNFFDYCAENQALEFSNQTVGCISKLLR